MVRVLSPPRLAADGVGCGVTDAVELVGRRGAGLHCTCSSDSELAERLDGTVAGLGCGGGVAGEDRSCSRLGIDRVGLAAASPVVTVRLVDLDHVHPAGTQSRDSWTRQGAGLIAQAPLRSRSPDRLCLGQGPTHSADRSDQGHQRGLADQRVRPSERNPARFLDDHRNGHTDHPCRYATGVAYAILPERTHRLTNGRNDRSARSPPHRMSQLPLGEPLAEPATRRRSTISPRRSRIGDRRYDKACSTTRQNYGRRRHD